MNKNCQESKSSHNSPLPSILMLSLLTPCTGNLTTAKRIIDSIDTQYRKLSQNCNDFESGTQLKSFTSKENVQFIIAIHAYRSGRLLIDLNIPYVLIFGGTDVSVMHRDEERLTVMTSAVKQSSAIVAFSAEMKNEALSIWPNIKDKLTIIPQAVSVSPSSFDFRHHIEKQTEALTLKGSTKILTLIAGLQTVKDPGFLLHQFSAWYKNSTQDVIFVIVGCVRDESYAEELLENINRLSGVFYVGSLSLSESHAAIQQSYAVINSSLNEGMCTAILESFLCGTPVIARDIINNRALVKHKHNGLLFNTPQDFIEMLELLLQDTILRQKMVENGKYRVEMEHNREKERKAYQLLINNTFKM